MIEEDPLPISNSGGMRHLLIHTSALEVEDEGMIELNGKRLNSKVDLKTEWYISFLFRSREELYLSVCKVQLDRKRD